MRDMRNPPDNGFTLVEVVIAMGILTAGLLSLAGVFVVGVKHLQSSTPSLIAREKAREAVESVHTARDMRIVTWDDIRNEPDGGVFLPGELDLNTPGPDGLVNTLDDGDVETHLSAGADNILGTPDDISIPLVDFKREITITDLVDGEGVTNESLRQITVTVKYRVGETWRTYTLTTYVSSYS